MLRSILYAIARLLGDVNAVKRHRCAKRLARKYIGRKVNRQLTKLFR